MQSDSLLKPLRKVIRNLGGRTKEIGAIVDVIDDVADETNLLALNAAIIAAQAGEHGRAFSVVADEIKDLAERVLASTKEIGDLIRSVQEEGENAIGAIETGTESVASGVDLSAEAGVSLEEITRVSRDSGERIQGILERGAGTGSRGLTRGRADGEGPRRRRRDSRRAATEQERGNTVVYRSTTAMRDVAQQVRTTTEEQSHGSGADSGERRGAARRGRADQPGAAGAGGCVSIGGGIHRGNLCADSGKRRVGATHGSGFEGIVEAVSRTQRRCAPISALKR